MTSRVSGWSAIGKSLETFQPTHHMYYIRHEHQTNTQYTYAKFQNRSCLLYENNFPKPGRGVFIDQSQIMHKRKAWHNIKKIGWSVCSSFDEDVIIICMYQSIFVEMEVISISGVDLMAFFWSNHYDSNISQDSADLGK